MAKSLRSKRKRKIRAEKRVVNAKKELVKLREVAAKLHGVKDQNGSITKESLESTIPDVHVTECPMQVDGQEAASTSKKHKVQIDARWMNQRKIKAIKSKIKKHNKKKSRRGGSAGLSSRKAKKIK
uniref:Protein LLP n=1 Tax=Aceria tosichella TaxID=561515 RepID=A0A6G1S4U4_9ACAR